MTWGLTGLLVAGVVTFATGVVMSPDTAWPAMLMTFFLLIGLGLGGALFIAIHDAAGATWARSIRRVPEAMAATVPWLGGLVLVILAGTHHLYSWSRPEVVAADPVLGLKHWWLNTPFFIVRSIGYVAVWTWAIMGLLRNAQAPAPDRAQLVRRGVIFAIVFGATFPLASMDWIMTLEPRWYSTIFGIYAFAGIFQSALAAIILLLAWFGTEGPAAEPSPGQLHDLGKMLFAFTCFWIYMWYSQYLLIWFANLPDEIRYFKAREGEWLVPLLALLLVNFVVPFFSLISKPFKRSPVMLGTVSVVVVLSHWLDLYLLIVPPFLPAGPRLAAPFILVPLGGVAAFLLVFRRQYRLSPAVHDA